MTENRVSFDNYRMQEVFYEYYSGGKTGVLKIFFPMNIVKTVYFSEGNIVFATSNSEKDKLTHILIKHKKITKEQLNMAMKQMDKSISLGRNLVNMGLITHKELVWAVKIQVLTIIYSIIMLKEGEYSSIEGVLPEGIIKLPLNTLKIIFDSLLLFKDKDWISQKISPETVFIKTNLFFDYKEKILPNSDYEKIYQLIDGEKTVSEIASMVDMEDFKVFKLFYALNFLKLIEEKVEINEEESQNVVVGNDEIFEIEGDDEENIGFVREMVGDKDEDEDDKTLLDREEDVYIDFDGVDSEQSISDESVDSEHLVQMDETVTMRKRPESEGGMDSIILDESDMMEEEKDEESERLKELEKLQQQLTSEEENGFKLEFEGEVKEEEIKKDDGKPESPYATAQQEISETKIQQLINSNKEDNSLIIDEEYLSPNKSGVGVYVSVILVLFIAALGFLGFRFYKESKSKEQKIAKMSSTEKIVTSKTDVTEQDITADKLEEIEKNLNNTNNTEPNLTVKETESIASGKVHTKPDVSSQEKTAGKASENVSFPASTEEKGMYDVETQSKQVEEKTSYETKNDSNYAIDDTKYTVYVSHSISKLITNPGKYTIQLELACLEETLDKAIKKLPNKSEIFFIPTTFRGKSCYLVCYGIFDTADEANSTLQTLDREFFIDNTPLIRPTEKFQKYF